MYSNKSQKKEIQFKEQEKDVKSNKHLNKKMMYPKVFPYNQIKVGFTILGFKEDNEELRL